MLGEYRPSLDAPDVVVFQPDTSASMSYNAVSPKGGLTYHIHDNNSVYAVYSRGFRTGGLTAFTGDPTQPGLLAYAPEYSNNMEIGAKNVFFENRLRVNLALFYSKVDDIQVSTVILPEGVAVTRNAGKLTSQGIELELSATPVRGLQIDASTGYTDASYDRLTLAVRNEEGGFDSFDFRNNKQLYTPRTTSMFAAQYTYPLSAWQSLRVVVRAELMHLGEQYFDLANSNRQAGYSLYNARVGVAASTFEIMFWGRNLGDKLYIAYAYDTGATRLGDPRNWGVTVRKSF